jgi:divinyl protochlorophyllide a 8-vinyl-reductase
MTDVALRGRIGPNAVTQLRAVLIDDLGSWEARDLFGAADLADLFDDPPTEMIDERAPVALFRALFARLDEREAIRLAETAGARVADYVIANRIPAKAVSLLTVLPPILGAPVLFQAIEKNAWTFAGSGRCDCDAKRRPQIEIRDNPLSMPGAAWHRAVFERLFRRLVCAGATVRAVTGRDGVDGFHVDVGKPCRVGRGKALCLNCVET